MSGEHMNPGESREQQVDELVKRLRTIQMSYWLPGLDIADKAEVDKEVDELCSQLVALGIDFDTLDLSGDTISE